jgi:RNA polymerase sigma-70 factor, ECF subfamily
MTDVLVLPEDVSETEALALLREGNIQGLEVLVRLHQLRALRAAYAICHDRQMAEDVVADAFLTVFERFDRYDSSRRFPPYFLRIVVNHTLKAVTFQGRSRPGGHSSTLLGATPDPDLDPADRVIAGEERDEIMQAINALPVKQRAVLVLRHYLDLDEREIAAVMGIPLGTVKWRLYAARRTLRPIFIGRLAAEQVPKGETP